MLDITQPTWLSTGGFWLYLVFCFRGSWRRKEGRSEGGGKKQGRSKKQGRREEVRKEGGKE